MKKRKIIWNIFSYAEPKPTVLRAEIAEKTILTVIIFTIISYNFHGKRKKSIIIITTCAITKNTQNFIEIKLLAFVWQLAKFLQFFKFIETQKTKIVEEKRKNINNELNIAKVKSWKLRDVVSWWSMTIANSTFVFATSLPVDDPNKKTKYPVPN